MLTETALASTSNAAPPFAIVSIPNRESLIPVPRSLFPVPNCPRSLPQAIPAITRHVISPAERAR